MTKRIIKAMGSPYVKILNHPTGMILGKRDEYDVNIQDVMEIAKKNIIAMEINAYRSDLNYQSAKIAKDMGIKLTLGSDAHCVKEMDDLRFALYQARRAGLSKEDVYNALHFEAKKLE
jgi:DNA polymerase (family 10)